MSFPHELNNPKPHPPMGDGAGIELAYLGLDPSMNIQKGKVAAIYVAILDTSGPFPAKLTAHATD